MGRWKEKALWLSTKTVVAVSLRDTLRRISIPYRRRLLGKYPLKMKPEKIRQLREELRVSQQVLAYYMNVSVGTVSEWERGKKTPNGSSLYLLWLIKDSGLYNIGISPEDDTNKRLHK